MCGPAGNALALFLLLTMAVPAASEVLDSGEAGFTTRHSVTIDALRPDVYRAAVSDIGRWWSDDHTLSGRAANLYVDARTQGCFCERFGEASGVVHMTVTLVNPTVLLRLSGGLGPLGLMGVNGNLTWEFADGDDGTLLTWTYAVGGYLPDESAELAAAVDRVLVEQMERLKIWVEAGSAAGRREG